MHPRAPPPPAPVAAQRSLRVLYLFSGTPRRWDMQSCLKQLCATEGLNLEMLCIDIKRKPWIDLSQSRERDKLVEQIKQGLFDAIIISPPCSTFSRACWANHRGPRPVRSYKSPKGLDTLTAAERRRCILGNIFADFTWEVLTLTSAMQLSFNCAPGTARRSGRYGI